MKLFLLKSQRLLGLLFCLSVQNVSCSFRSLSYGPTHLSVLDLILGAQGVPALDSPPLSSNSRDDFFFLFPCLRLPYVSCAEVPSDITKIALCAVIFGALCEAPVTGVPSGGLCCWSIDPICSHTALTGSHQ